MLTFWIIVLSLGLLSVLVPPFASFIGNLIVWPAVLILYPFIALTDYVKGKQGIKGETEEEDKEMRKRRTNVFCGIFAAIVFPLCIISIIIMIIMMKHNSEVLLYSDMKIILLFIGIPAIVSAIIAWLILLIFRRDV